MQYQQAVDPVVGYSDADISSKPIRPIVNIERVGGISITPISPKNVHRSFWNSNTRKTSMWRLGVGPPRKPNTWPVCHHFVSRPTLCFCVFRSQSWS